MKIIRWLLSHTVLILLIVAVIYGYMFWGNLAGEDTPAGKALGYLSNEFYEVSEFVAAVKAKQEKLSQQEPSGIESSAAPQPSPANDVFAVAESVDSGRQPQLAETQANKQTAEKNNFAAPVAESSSTELTAINDSSEAISENKEIEQQQVITNYSDNGTSVKLNAAGIIAATVEPVDDVPTSNLHSESTVSNVKPASNGVTVGGFVSTEIEKQLDNVDQHGKLKHDGLKSGSQQGGDIRADWIAARKSFYQRKYDLSEQNYKKVIDSTEDNVDAYGELGNVYFNQGKKEQAATAYFEAAAILVRKGQVNRALSLMGLLRNLDRSKAGELQKLIDSAESKI